MKKLILSVIMLTGLTAFAQEKPAKVKAGVKTETTTTKASSTTTDTDAGVKSADGTQVRTATDVPATTNQTNTATQSEMKVTTPADKKRPAETVSPK